MGELDLAAFLDESRKPVRDPRTGRPVPSGLHYVVAASIVLHGDSEPLRANLTAIAHDVGRPLHYADLGTKGRVRTLTALGELDRWEGLIYETSDPINERIPERRTRARLLKTAFPDLVINHEVQTITMETRSTPIKGFHQLDEQDHSTWRSLIDRGSIPAGPTLGHKDKSEPLLWVPDLLAGVRSDHLCVVNRSNFALISHRVSSIVSVSG